MAHNSKRVEQGDRKCVCVGLSFYMGGQGRLAWESDIWVSSWKKWGSQACDCLGKEYLKQRKQQVQRLWGGSMPGMFRGLGGDHCGWNRMSQGRTCGERDWRSSILSRCFSVIVGNSFYSEGVGSLGRVWAEQYKIWLSISIGSLWLH